MAAGNESQGLKYGVISLSVILLLSLVGNYLLYSSYSKTTEELAKAQQTANQAPVEINKLKGEFENLRQLAGVGQPNVALDAIRQDAAAKAGEVQAEIAKINQDIAATIQKINEEAAKSGSPEYASLGSDLEALRRQAQSLADGFRPDANLLTQLNQLAGILQANHRISSRLAQENVALRLALASIDSAKTGQIRAVEDDLAKRSDELKAAIAESDETQRNLRTNLGNLQRENQDRARQADELRNTLASQKTQSEEVRKELLTNINQLREEASRREGVLDVPDGKILFVDQRRGEVQLNITRSMGVRPQMLFSVFDKNAPAVPATRAKGTVEVVRVGDDYSVARILNTRDIGDPIAVDDLIHSPVWNRNEPQLFALIGKIDINRDGADDRDEVKRMIENAGGRVIYDLPPGNIGPESGKLTPRVAYYIVDDQEPFAPFAPKPPPPSPEELASLQRQTDAIAEARSYGIQPMPLRRLYNFLMYSPDKTEKGTIQFRDNRRIDALLNEGRPANPVPTDADTGDEDY